MRLLTLTEVDKNCAPELSVKHGFIFACTDKSENTLLSSGIIATGKNYANKLFSVKRNDMLFLYNLDKDVLYGTFITESEPLYDKKSPFFNGKYPYYIYIKPIDTLRKIEKASTVFKSLGISWRDILTEKGANIFKHILEGKPIGRHKREELVDDRYIPPIMTTTLWDYPYQSYGYTKKGNNKYAGVTPAFIIYNLIWRYTEPGDIVCDPMAGSGTTIDVCLEERRRVVAFDIVPTRKDIIQADARNIPLKDESVDMVFVDSPYGDNIRYNDHHLNIGHIPATSDEFYDELEKVMQECYRILKKGKVLAWLIGDQWAKGEYVPVGWKIYERLTKYFYPLDVVCVVRRNQSSNTPFWHSKAIEHNFYLRGFKYLIIVKKPEDEKVPPKGKKVRIKWNFYER